MNLKNITPKFIQEINTFHPMKDDLGVIFGITIIPLIFFVPLIIFLLIIAPGSTLASLPLYIWILLKFTLFFFLISLGASRQAREFLLNAIQKPLIITTGFLISTFFIIYHNYSVFTREEGIWFKNVLPYAVIVWLIFIVIQSKWFISRVPRWMLWVIRVPVWAVMFFYALIFIEIDGMALFSKLF